MFLFNKPITLNKFNTVIENTQYIKCTLLEYGTITLFI